MSHRPRTVLVGADMHVTVIEWFKPSKKRCKVWTWSCSCPRGASPWRWADSMRVYVRAEVHARLWHGAEPDRRWKR